MIRRDAHCELAAHLLTVRNHAKDDLGLYDEFHPRPYRQRTPHRQAESTRRDIDDGDSEGGAVASIVEQFESAEEVDREPAMESSFLGHNQGNRWLAGGLDRWIAAGAWDLLPR